MEVDLVVVVVVVSYGRLMKLGKFVNVDVKEEDWFYWKC